MSIEHIIYGVIEREGGFVNHPSDRGGPTKYGITLQTLRDWRGLPVSVKELQALSKADAFSIYYRRYVVDPGFDHVLRLNAEIAEEMIDAGVLSGPRRPVEWLQTALNKFNRGGLLYPDIAIDGRLGPATLAALRAYLDQRGPDAPAVMVKALDALQGAYFVEITKAREANEDFIYGWFKHRIGNV